MQIALADVALLARVQRPVVSMWRQRNAHSTTPFPSLVAMDAGSELFDADAVVTGTPSELINSMFDPTFTYEDLDCLREVWNGKLVVKGILTVDDAKKAVDHGAVIAAMALSADFTLLGRAYLLGLMAGGTVQP